jgi:hopanoid biosynthesis associated protein HpnK
MAAFPTARRLIVNADDFGRSHSINAAVARAHREGILTSASLMVNEAACAEAVTLARENPRLSVGLHLTLLGGHSALPPERIHGLTDAHGRFSDSPVATGWRYFFRRELREPLRAEIAAQFDRFAATGLPCDHVNGHLHIHLHPVILPMVLENAARQGITRLRLTRDPFFLNARLAGGRWLYRLSHAAVFGALARRSRPLLEQRGFRCTDAVFGLLQNGRVDEEFLCRLLPRLPAGDSELYSHPGLGGHQCEFDALVSPRVRTIVGEQAVLLTRYRDL